MEQQSYNNDMKGALWSRVSKNNVKFLSGTVEIGGQKFGLAIFKNDKKKSDKHPDYRVLVKDLDEQNKSTQRPVQSKEVDIDEIPF
jgi:hypothetical protein